MINANMIDGRNILQSIIKWCLQPPHQSSIFPLTVWFYRSWSYYWSRRVHYSNWRGRWGRRMRFGWEQGGFCGGKDWFRGEFGLLTWMWRRWRVWWGSCDSGRGNWGHWGRGLRSRRLNSRRLRGGGRVSHSLVILRLQRLGFRWLIGGVFWGWNRCNIFCSFILQIIIIGSFLL